MEWEHEESVGFVGEDRSSDYEGGNDGADNAAAKDGEGALRHGGGGW